MDYEQPLVFLTPLSVTRKKAPRRFLELGLLAIYFIHTEMFSLRKRKRKKTNLQS